MNNENKDVNLNLGSRITLRDVTGLGSEWRIDASLGSTLGFGTEFYQPLGRERPVHGGAFLSPRASYTRTTENLYTDRGGSGSPARHSGCWKLRTRPKRLVPWKAPCSSPTPRVLRHGRRLR